MNKSAIRWMAAAGLTAMAAGTAAAEPIDQKTLQREGVRREMTRQAAVRGRAVSVSGSASTIRIQQGPGDQAAARATLLFWSSDQALMSRVQEGFDLVLRESGAAVSFEVKLPSTSGRGRREVTYDLELSVTVPAGARLEVDNEFGDVEVRGVGGPIAVENNSGNITIEGPGDPVTVDGRFGDVVVERALGKVTIATSSGRVRVAEVKGKAVVSSSYGDVEVTGAEAGVAVATSSGNVSASGVRGEAKISASYGNVSARGMAGPVAIAVTSGNVTADDIGDDLSVQCSFGSVRARGVTGDLGVKGASTPIHAEEIEGNVTVENSFGGVHIDGVSGAVTVGNQSGSVTVRGLQGRALSAEHTVAVSFGDVEFAWPAGRPVSYRLETSFGGIRSDLPASARESGSSVKVLEGRIGSGGAVLTLSAQSGGITLISK